MDFEAYLISKKIDSARFAKAEPVLWNAWKLEFEQVHPNSFTAQKLYLINPIRRKYQLKLEDIPKIVKPEIRLEKKDDVTGLPAPSPDTTPPPTKPVVPRPIFKPKPKMT